MYSMFNNRAQQRSNLGGRAGILGMEENAKPKQNLIGKFDIRALVKQFEILYVRCYPASCMQTLNSKP